VRRKSAIGEVGNQVAARGTRLVREAQPDQYNAARLDDRRPARQSDRPLADG
jgi:hypothetical protein